MKNHSPYFWGARQVLIAAALSLFAGLTHATAVYDATAQASLTIDAITNLTNPGDLTGLSITGWTNPENGGSTTFGNAQATFDGLIDLQDSTASSPGWLRQESEAHGNAEAPPQLNIASSFHDSQGAFELRNDSPTDSFQIDFSLVYDLAVGAGVTSLLTESAFAEAYIRLIDDLLQIDVDETLIADALGVLGPGSDSKGDTILFSITLDPNTFDRLSLEVAASGLAQAVAEPDMMPLFGIGLFGLAGAFRRRVTAA